MYITRFITCVISNDKSCGLLVLETEISKKKYTKNFSDRWSSVSRCSGWPRDNEGNKSLANYSCCCKAYGLLTVFVAYHQLWTTHRIFRKLQDHLLMKIYNNNKHDQKTDL